MFAKTLAAGLLMATAAAAELPVLTVYAPDYFGSEWGPGPSIEMAFEASCGCDLQYRTGDLLPRILLEGVKTEADVAIGFTTDETKRARETGLFAPHGQPTDDLTLPVAWTDDTFLPFNWGHTAFIYDRTKLTNPPKSFDDLLALPDDVKIVIQDPRSSISGLALVLWVKAVKGDQAEAYWAALAPHILTVTKGWSESYGLFTKGEADMVLSYTTSPAYHLMAEQDDTKVAAIFSEGHYFMAETAAKLAGSKQPELAQSFIDFVLSPEFQKMIPGANYSFPAKLPADQLPDAFKQLNMPEKVIFYSEDEAAALRETAIAEWQRGMTQ